MRYHLPPEGKVGRYRVWNNVIVVSLVGAQSTRATNANAFAVSAVCNEVLCCRFACPPAGGGHRELQCPVYTERTFLTLNPGHANGYGGNQPCAPDGIRWDIAYLLQLPTPSVFVHTPSRTTNHTLHTVPPNTTYHHHYRPFFSTHRVRWQTAPSIPRSW